MSQTQIIQCIVPNLVAGEYEVEVAQTIQANSDIQAINKNFTFGVDAARFTINANDIYSVYPPENTTGDYSGHLPHVVFNRRTLPWERTIDGLEPLYKREKKEPVDCPPCPWMALLLFTEEEMQWLNISATKIGDTIADNQTDDILLKAQITKNNPPLKLMPWETQDQTCMTIDISAQQFQSLVPGSDDLPLLAHSKLVLIDHKDINGIEDVETLSETNTYTLDAYKSQHKSDPNNEQTGEKETVEVSKEKITGNGYFSVLIGNRLITSKGAYTAILVSLEGFGEYISSPPSKAITQKKVRLVVLAHWTYNNHGQKTFKTLLDHVEVKSMVVNTTSDGLKPYLDQGYVPMKHRMKNGASNMSWYRGPYVPNEVGFNTFQFEAFESSDGALRYDKDTGLMDASISAAWELGKMLALQHQEFTKAIVAWNTDPIDNPNVEQTTSYTKAELIAWLEDGSQKQKVKETGFVTFKPYPKVVVDFLKDLAGLKGVPISYLLPDKKYIAHHDENNEGKGTLNIFYVDPLWVYALLEGAVSLLSKHHTQTRYNIINIIQKVYYFKGESKAMGFILHSPLVSGWRGIEIKGYKDGGTTPLDLPIRFERILPDVFLGIFPDTFSSIEVIQPYEGLHFGVKQEVQQGFSKTIKDEDGNTDQNNKVMITQGGLMNDKNTLRIAQMAQGLKGYTSEQVFTSAQFAYQMIDSPILATFNIKPQIQ